MTDATTTDAGTDEIGPGSDPDAAAVLTAPNGTNGAIGAGDSGHGAPAGGTAGGMGGAPRSMDLLHGVEMTVTVELGRTKMLLGELLALRSGSIVELDRAAGSPVDVLINGTLLAHGEVVVVDDEFGVRITTIVSGDDPARGQVAP